MSAIPFALMAGLGLFVFYALHLSKRQRAEAIRVLAARSGMHYLGNALPRSLTLAGTPFYRASKVWNVIDGEPRGTRIMAMDCQVGVGKHSWRRTVIAVEGEDKALERLPFVPDMTIDRSGRWKILYRERSLFSFRGAGLMPVDELDANLTAVIAESAKNSLDSSR